MNPDLRIALGCDEAALELKNALYAFLRERGVTVTDFGVFSEAPSLYPDMAAAVALSIVEGQNDRGILLCGTGLGMAITANKIPGIRAATCHDPYSAERARKSNDAQVLTMGAKVIGPELAKVLVSIWLEAEFQGGKSAPKVDRISEIEKRYLKGTGEA